jgi:dienelactone hydrolase
MPRMPFLVVAALTTTVAAVGLLGCLTQSIEADIDHFQPPITVTEPPANPLNGTYSLANNVRRTGLAKIEPLIPAFNGKGMLLASWNPSPTGITSSPTFVIFHGGHGIVPTDFEMAWWLHKDVKANVLILDSFWSRGQSQNFITRSRYGANMRVLDAIAAGRWLKDKKGTQPTTTFMIGGSQGGWTVLRAFTNEPWLKEQVEPLYKGGVSLYPVCIADGSSYKPTLGPYFAPVIIFTGGSDAATPAAECARPIFTSAKEWVNYPGQTHSWDVSTHGAGNPTEDGKCFRALNTFLAFPVCRSNATTDDMRRRILGFVNSNKA